MAHVTSGKAANATATVTPTVNGATVTTTETNSSSTNFSLRGLGSVLGLSVAYLF